MELGAESELSRNINAPYIDPSDLEDAKNIDDRLSANTMERFLSYNLASLSDVLKPDTSSSLYTINVENEQILQVELQVPQNLSLNYDLYLFEMNASSTELTLVSGSEYATDAAFMPESAGAINRSGDVITYVIMVNAKEIPSSTDYYTLNVSIGEHVEATSEMPTNAFEPNESAFFAVEFPTITSTTYVTVPGGLNTPIDNDWFSLYINNTSEFAGLEVAGVPQSAVVESYTVSNGNLLTKRGSTLEGSTLPLATGYNYFRVKFDGDGAFSPVDYSIKFTPALNATKVLTLIAVDGYCQRYSNLFNDGLNRALYTRGSKIRVWVQYLTDNNIRVKVSDTVDVSIFNPAWDHSNMQYEKANATVNNSYDCSVYLNAPVLCGDKYDIVLTTITSQKFGKLVSKASAALLDHYDNGETSRPCRHNGTCGLK